MPDINDPRLAGVPVAMRQRFLKQLAEQLSAPACVPAADADV